MAPTTGTVKLKKSIADMVKWMNSEGELAAELRLAAVAKPLAALDESTALEVLNGLLEQEEVIDDPTVWIIEAAKALAEAEAEEAPGLDFPAAAAATPRPSGGAKVKLPASTVEKLKELNASGCLQVNLPLAEVAQSLSLLSKESQEELLAGLEQNAADITNPAGWLCNACHKKAGKGKGKGKGKDKGKGKGKHGSAESGFKPLTASERKILRTINFINKTMGLERPLNFNYLKEALDLVDEKTQLRILDILKEKLEEGQEIANPTTWVKRACQRQSERYEERRQEKLKQKRQAEEGWEEAKPKKKKAAAAAEEAWEEAAGEDEQEWAEE
uniref:Uncharacterized protein n=1 Tax=Alexandrium monilatum TaxID=311494 RepID=A0A7S4SMQ8_9DINO|mmetsp:Transcript_18641/g.58586  ORF Transcript_18641/g.58586 Transcript_18641/m.58586 type:complete len:330 (-) Transcript_18641:116-1105(-)